jgi:hypothetical protein
LGCGKVERSGGYEGGVFAEAVAGNVIGLAGFGLQDAVGGYGNGEQGRLGVFGLFEFVVGAFEAEAGEGKAEGVVGLFKALARGGKGLGEGTAHAGELGSLPREKEGGLHRTFIIIQWWRRG